MFTLQRITKVSGGLFMLLVSMALLPSESQSQPPKTAPKTPPPKVRANMPFVPAPPPNFGVAVPPNQLNQSAAFFGQSFNGVTFPGQFGGGNFGGGALAGNTFAGFNNQVVGAATNGGNFGGNFTQFAPGGFVPISNPNFFQNQIQQNFQTAFQIQAMQQALLNQVQNGSNLVGGFNGLGVAGGFNGFGAGGFNGFPAGGFNGFPVGGVGGFNGFGVGGFNGFGVGGFNGLPPVNNFGVGGFNNGFGFNGGKLVGGGFGFNGGFGQ